MKNFINFINKYKVHILSSLIFITLFRGCHFKNSTKRVLKQHNEYVEKKDSVLQEYMGIIEEQKNIITQYHKTLKKEKMDIHLFYDNWISSKDRGQQLMELHIVVRDNIRNLQNNQ
jgi:hypothetical protein